MYTVSDVVLSKTHPTLEEMNVVEFQTTVLEARHHPACVLFREQGI